MREQLRMAKATMRPAQTARAMHIISGGRMFVLTEEAALEMASRRRDREGDRRQLYRRDVERSSGGRSPWIGPALWWTGIWAAWGLALYWAGLLAGWL